MADYLAVYNALLSRCNDQRVAKSLNEGLKVGFKAGGSAAIGFLVGGPIGGAIGGLVGSIWAASTAEGKSLVEVLRELNEEEKYEVVLALRGALTEGAIIKASTSLLSLANIIRQGDSLEDIFNVLSPILAEYRT